MTYETALKDPTFRLYLIIIVSLLAGVAIILFCLQRFVKWNVKSIWVTYRAWLVMALVIAGTIFMGRVAVIAGVMLLSIFAFKEFSKATGLYRDWWMTGAVYLAIVGVAATSLVDDPFRPGYPGWLGLFMAMPVFAISFLLIIPILRNKTQGQLQLVALSILGFIYIGWMFAHLGFLANSNRPYVYLLFILLATELNDVAAFTFGKLFGKHPLRSAISPKKTWEGSLGALAFSLALPFALRPTFPDSFTTGELLLIGLIVGVGGQLGDLCISFIKRDIGVKDMGATIPGHGGLLDRIDSLIFVTPLFLHTVRFFHDIR